MTKKQNAIVIMAKRPQAGKTKTRLCPPFSPEGAALLFEALLKDTIALVVGLKEVQLAIAFSPPGSQDYFGSITPPGTLLLPIEGENIGVCLEKALVLLLNRGYKKALALNADGPSLPGEYLLHAFDLLENCDVVLGPGEDGGYSFVALSRMHKKLFEDIPWSTDAVLETTVSQAARLGLRVSLAPTWYDVDSPADVQRLRDELALLPGDRLVNTRKYLQTSLDI